MLCFLLSLMVFCAVFANKNEIGEVADNLYLLSLSKIISIDGACGGDVLCSCSSRFKLSKSGRDALP